MPFLKKYKESRIKQLEQKCQKNGFISYFVDPERGFFYKGNWKNDKKSGFGHQVFRREKLCYEGYFENDLFHGYGRLGKVLPDGTTEVIYEGCWANGKMNGPGRWFISENKKEKVCEPPRRELKTSLSDLKKDMDLPETMEQEENREDGHSFISDFIYKDFDAQLDSPKDFDVDSFWGVMMGRVDSDLAVSDVEISCCCSVTNEATEGSVGSLLTKSKSQIGTENSPDDKVDKHSLQKTLDRASSDLPYTRSPTKAPLISNQISFKELKQIYNEFQNRVREGKKTDEWDEFVNQAQFRVRPDPQQERIDYVPPNFKDYRITCPKGIFYQNDNADKMSIRDNENLHAVLNVAEKIKRKKTLGLKSIDETQLKFYLYDGNMKDNLPDGIGMGYFQDDIYYYGKWKGGKFNGKGVLMSLNEYSYEGDFENGVRLGHGVYTNYQNGYVQKGFWANGSFVESTVEISYRRQSAVYPVIFPIPDLAVCDHKEDVDTSRDVERKFCKS